MRDFYWLSDAQMAKLEPFFPKPHGKPRVDDRRVLSGIIFINRNGLHWRDAPAEYGPHKTLYSRWNPDIHRGAICRSNDRAVGDKGRDGRPRLRRLRRKGSGARTGARNSGHPRLPRDTQKRQGRQGHARGWMLVLVPSTIQSRFEPHRNGLLQTQGPLAPHRSTHFHRHVQCHR